ncbi:MAG: lecithin retinol acyltransferase family protein [Steroidobacteraceae bacterium]|nr:lecithin retinol acyltransferase family protein [Steroidobacteraceae bacterium]MBP7012629.1 lecithin retinol acyltransferase family protein [Steroidobacteraceae bacterium]
MARADHITVPRLGGVFVHHGIDCGDGTVIHFTGATWAEPRSVRRTSMQEFARGAAVAVRDYREFFERLEQPENLPRRVRIRWQRELARLAGDDRGRTEFAPGAVIRRAEGRLGNSGFDIVLNNCEHFATWCKTGISDSEQVHAIWRTILDPMSYMGLRSSQLLSASFEALPQFGRVRSPQARRRPRR